MRMLVSKTNKGRFDMGLSVDVDERSCCAAIAGQLSVYFQPRLVAHDGGELVGAGIGGVDVVPNETSVDVVAVAVGCTWREIATACLGPQSARTPKLCQAGS